MKDLYFVRCPVCFAEADYDTKREADRRARELDKRVREEAAAALKRQRRLEGTVIDLMATIGALAGDGQSRMADRSLRKARAVLMASTKGEA